MFKANFRQIGGICLCLLKSKHRKVFQSFVWFLTITGCYAIRMNLCIKIADMNIIWVLQP